MPCTLYRGGCGGDTHGGSAALILSAMLMLSAALILSAGRDAVPRSESSSQGYRLSAASLTAPFNKGAEPTLCADGRFVRS